MATVVLLHGLARARRSMARMQRALHAAGYGTWAESYPSRRLGVAALAAGLAERIRAEVPPGDLYAVTHSLGGILVRHMASALPWRGVVMVAPPNGGSRMARLLRERAFFRWFYGPVLRELGSPAGWPAPPSPFGVIAGTRGLSVVNPVSWVSAGTGALPSTLPGDGTVAVEETLHPAMSAFAMVDASHTWIMDHPRVHRCVLSFLATGGFGVDGTDPPRGI